VVYPEGSPVRSSVKNATRAVFSGKYKFYLKNRRIGKNIDIL